jgi:uncharacterized damage-inducible protein DinB
MKLTDLFLAELEREADRSRRALEQVPANKYDWKPHERSMNFGYLAEIVATIPSWLTMTITRDELELQPKDGTTLKREPMHTSEEFLEAHEEAVTGARAAISGTDDEFLRTPWRLLVGGNVVMEQPRHVVMRETLNHLAHHRGQMTVYLRLMGAKVPALYGPSADDQRF